METKIAVWFCIPPVIDLLRKVRRQHYGDIRAGLNFSIIINSACYFEGALESGLVALTQVKGLGEHPLCSSLVRDLRSQIGRAHGRKAYDDLAKRIVGASFSELRHTKSLSSAFDIFFKLRHLIAHGRAIASQVTFPAGPNKKWKDEYVGVFKEVNVFMTRLGIIKTQRSLVEPEWFYLADEVADFAWQFANLFILRIGDSLVDGEQERFTASTSAPHHTMIGKLGQDSLEKRILALGRPHTKATR